MSQQKNVACATLAERLKKQRESAGLSMRALAKMAGIDVSYLSRMEAGANTAPSRDVLSNLARALSVSVAWITCNTDDPSPAAPIGNSGNQEAPADPVAGTVACRYPADCDLPAQITALRDDLDEIKSQMRTLLGLLGPPLREGLGKRQQQAG